MRRNIPLSLFRIFEAAARSLSFRAAAAELNLTPSAVSHAIRKLETSLGAKLFDRQGRTVRLSAEGEVLMHHTRSAFEELWRGMDTVSTRVPRLLRLHCAPSFAAQWLSPRLSRFLAEHPGTQVRLAASTDYPRFVTDEFDAGIMYGPPRQEGLTQISLGEETVTPLCAQELALQIGSTADLSRCVLIESDNKRVRWAHWFSANALSSPAPQGVRFDRSFLAIAAAVDGLGVALESTRLAEREISSGKLTAPLAGKAQDVRYAAHYLVYPPASAARVGTFARWLMRELGL